MAQTGYPWTLDLHVLYDLSADGLTVTQTATNMSSEPAPYASGAHPYLRVGPGPVDGLELTLPAAHPLAGRRPAAAGGARGRRGHGVRLPGGAPDPRHGARRGLHRPRPGRRRAWPPRRCATRRPEPGSRCGSTGTTAGCRSSPATTSPVRPRGSLAVEPMTAPRRRVPQRRGPRHAGAGGRARRRALRLLGRARAGVTGRRPGGRRSASARCRPGCPGRGGAPGDFSSGDSARAIQFRATGSPDRHRSGSPQRVRAGAPRRTRSRSGPPSPACPSGWRARCGRSRCRRPRGRRCRR